MLIVHVHEGTSIPAEDFTGSLGGQALAVLFQRNFHFIEHM
jgi:hypothetical protein